MTELEYRPGKLMALEPINVTMAAVIRTLRLGEPIVVILEPGDATRYTLLLVPLRHNVSPYLQGFGIQPWEANNYLFVSKLSTDECPGTWVPFGPGQRVGTHDVTELSSNDWSQRFLSWWLTNLNEAL